METPSEKNWAQIASLALRKEMQTRGVSNAKLADLLSEHGLAEKSEKSLSRALSSGGFSAVFLVQCLYVMGATSFSFVVDL